LDELFAIGPLRRADLILGPSHFLPPPVPALIVTQFTCMEWSRTLQSFSEMAR
jgi:hypothetical protein